MKKHTVSIVRYEKPFESVQRAVSLCSGLNNMPAGAKVFVKPNIVFWTRSTAFPKWGVITTSRVIEDVVRLLKDLGIGDITIGEGTVLLDPKDRQTIPHAFETLGYSVLKKRYGVKTINVFDRPFRNVDLGDGVTLAFNSDLLDSDYVVNLPVLKTHAQTIVSLGIKNLKGAIDIASRKDCHSDEAGKDLHTKVAKLADKMPPMFTLLDGIFTSERGPGFDGRLRRSNLLVASRDVLSADMIGARILGKVPAEIPHLMHAALNRKRPLDFSDIDVVGEEPSVATNYHRHDFPYNKTDTLPLPMEKMKIQGLSYRRYDLTLCTYCSFVNGALLSAIAGAWKGTPWDNVEVLTGKSMTPTPGMKQTILLGRCMYRKNKDNPDIRQMLAVKSCPPQPEAIVKAFHQAGIPIDPDFGKDLDRYPGLFMRRYQNRPEFDEAFFRIEP